MQNKLKQYRKKYKLTQQEIADYLGICLVAYHNYEHGVRDIPSKYLYKLEELYKVSTRQLMGWDSEEYEELKKETDNQIDFLKKITKDQIHVANSKNLLVLLIFYFLNYYKINFSLKSRSR